MMKVKITDVAKARRFRATVSHVINHTPLRIPLKRPIK